MALSELVRLDASPPFRAAQVLCERAEREIRLIDRAQPLNLAEERARLLDELASGQEPVARLEYARPPELSALRRELERAALTLAVFGPLGVLYAERVRELETEAALAEAVGSPDFAERAASRFSLARGPDTECAERWAAEWICETAAPPRDHYSDDERDPRSLIAVVRRRSLELGLSIRVELREPQSAAAVAGDGFVAIRPGLRQTANEAERIALHELEGHALPRQRARSEPLALFRVGSAGSSEDEEGRALWLERHARLCDAPRRAELARRHSAARAARAGAPFGVACRALLARGVEPEPALDATLRAYRGGGLARELVYLPALARVTRVFAEEPALAGWLARGRLSVAAARVLAG